jgi:hypothetical protein
VTCGLALAQAPQAVSGDGRWHLLVDPTSDTLTVLDHNRVLVRSYPVVSRDGKIRSHAVAVHDALARHSFVVVLQDLPELWEISYDPQAEPIFEGLVHDYKMGEGLGTPGFLGVRRIQLEEPLDDIVFDDSFRHALGFVRLGPNALAVAHVVNLDVRRRIASIAVPGKPLPGTVRRVVQQGRVLIVWDNASDARPVQVDAKTWKLLPLPDGSGQTDAPGRQPQ